MTRTLVPVGHRVHLLGLHHEQPSEGVKVKMPCYCSSYAFPHRTGSGKCNAMTQMVRFSTGAIVRAVEQLCAACGQPAEVIEEDQGIGPYEFWGACGVDTRIVEVTSCCSSHLVDNSMANKREHKWYPVSKKYVNTSQTTSSGSP